MIEMKTDMMKKSFRQGDILLVPAQLPEGAVRKDNVIQIGETTGHSHRIEEGEVYLKDGKQYVIALQKTQVVHEEHHAIQLPKGAYEVRRKREFSPLAERKVSD